MPEESTTPDLVELTRQTIDAMTWMETFPDVRLEFPGESVDLGDQVITPTHLVGTARATGIEVREPYSFLIKVSEHTIVLAREFHNNAEVLKALGLEG